MAKLRFNADTPLYTSDERGWKMNESYEVLDRLRETGKPIVIFVHGRGKEPNKSLRGGTFVSGRAIHKLEQGYNVAALLFNWDSAFPGFQAWDRTRPIKNSLAGSEVLGRLLHHLSIWNERQPPPSKPVLLAHSMGAFVLKHAIESGFWPERSLLKRILITQPDTDDVGHAGWLQPLAQREQVYCTFNHNDKVLLRSRDNRPDGAQPLGLGTNQTLAPSAHYIDLSEMGPLGSDEDDDHEVFAQGAMDGQQHVLHFFVQALRGDAVDLTVGNNVASVDREVIYRLRSTLS